MARSPFVSYPRGRGPVKLLLYGDPGALKTRRALAMPGPRFMIDLEKGADEYGDLVSEGDQYLACQSHATLLEALSYLENLPAAQVGTVIVDPITVVWQSLQAGHAERQSSKKKIAPEEVMFDQGVWSRLNRVHNDLVTRLLNATFHVVMICRGKELRDAKGEQVVGYSYDGHKSLEFLAKTVIQTRRTGDLVLKDRTGTWPEGHRAQRLDLRELLGAAGTGGARLETASEAARRDAGSSSPSSSTSGGLSPEGLPRRGGGTTSEGGQGRWTSDQEGEFLTGVAKAWPEWPGLGNLTAWCEAHGHPRPSEMTPARRAKLLEALSKLEKQHDIQEWLGRQDEQQGAA